MIETKFEIPTIATETLLLRPDGIADFPGVVFLADIWGIRPANIGMARRLAEKGFAVLVPTALHRYSRVKPGGPHKQLPRVKARLYFGHAVEDQSATPEQIAILEEALRNWHGAFQSEVYEGALHGWTVPGRPVYNELQAERAFEKEVELFDATLK